MLIVEKSLTKESNQARIAQLSPKPFKAKFPAFMQFNHNKIKK